MFHIPNISQLDGMFVLQSDTNIATQTAADAFCSEVSSTGCQARERRGRGGGCERCRGLGGEGSEGRGWLWGGVGGKWWILVCIRIACY